MVNDLNVIFFGIRRGGQHAIINWVAAHFDAPIWFFNDIADFNNPEPTADDTGAADLPGYIKNPMSIPHVWRIPKKVLFQSYEDKSIRELNFEANARVIGPSRRTVCIIILRDLFNTIASRLPPVAVFYGDEYWLADGCHDRCVPGSIFVVTPALRETWIEYAREVIGETHYLPNMVFINYNFWFKSNAYRRRLEKLMGLGVTDRGMEKVSGIGSSFSGREHDGCAQEMKVEERWKVYCHEDRYVNFFRFPRLWEIHDTLFGKIAEPMRAIVFSQQAKEVNCEDTIRPDKG